jgi:serine/threonine protein kinase
MKRTKNRHRKTNEKPRRMTRSKRGGKIVGVGSYGCVFKPSLPCKGQVSPDPGTISKFMGKRHSSKEINEYKRMDEIDPTNNFHLKGPKECIPKYESKTVLEEIKNCNIDEMKQIIPLINPLKPFIPNQPNLPPNIKTILTQNMSLLIEPDGGVDLSKLEQGSRLPKEILRLLIECRRLFNGVVVMDKKKFNHMDIKPENVVYDIAKNRINYIDFGMSDFQSEYRNIVNGWSDNKFHYNTVIENIFITSDPKKKPGLLSQPVGLRWPSNVPFFETEEKGGSVAAFNEFVEKTMTRYFFDTTQGNVMQERFKKDFVGLVRILEKGFIVRENKTPEKITYESFCSLVSQRVNIYQLGLNMKFILTHIGKPIMGIKKEGRNLYGNLRELFYKMMHPNVFQRLSSQGPPTILERYDNILIFYGIIGPNPYDNKKDSFIKGPLMKQL